MNEQNEIKGDAIEECEQAREQAECNEQAPEPAPMTDETLSDMERLAEECIEYAIPQWRR